MSAPHAAPAQFVPDQLVPARFAPPDEPPSILVVESDHDHARAIRADLERGGFRARLARGAAEALTSVQARGCMAVVLNLDIEDGGDELVARLRNFGAGPILTLCPDGDSTSRVRALAAGADDCLPLPYHQGEFVARLRAHLRRRALYLTRVGDLVLQPQTYLVSFGGRPIGLRRGEFRILRLLASDAGRVFERGEIERALWLEEGAPHTNAVNMQVSNLRKKLETVGLRGALRTVRGVGYALRPDRLQGR